MAFSLRQWRATHLLGAWALYWLGLVLVKLGPAILALVPAVTGPPGHGRFDVSMGDGIVKATVTSDAGHWAGSTSVMTLVLWLCGPPLLLWLFWLVTRRSPAPARETERDYRVS